MGSNGELRFRQRKGNPAERKRELKPRRVTPQGDALTRKGAWMYAQHLGA